MAAKNDQLLAEMKTEEARIVAALKSQPAEPKVVDQLRQRLVETRRMLRLTAENSSQIAPLLKQARASATVTTAIDADRRRPTKSDLGGVWSTGANLVGYTIQLEQDGTSITGQGYHWGCLGVNGAFQIHGAYREGVLSLTFEESSTAKKAATRVFRYKDEKGRPEFRRASGEMIETLEPLEDLRRQIEVMNLLRENAESLQQVVE